MQTYRRSLAAGVTALAIILSCAGTAAAGPESIPGTAGARTVTDTPEDPRPAFYEPPATIPQSPGQIIRSEPANFLLDPLGLSAAAVTATRVMYASTDRRGRAIAVTGTVFVPRAPWVGPGQRPLVSFAAGTQGMADRCAPSRQLAEAVEYETGGLKTLITRGYAVVLTDYQGLSTPGSHTYVVREAQGRAVLDAARAAKNLPGSGLPANTPVGLTGYSQGGNAVAAAAELAADYAPDLDVRGTLAGAVPADLAAVGEHVDGGAYAGFLAYALVGLSAGHQIDPNDYLNEAGRQYASEVEQSCVSDVVTRFGFRHSSAYTRDGRPLSAYFAEEPWASILQDNQLGRRTPSAPVSLDHSLLDDVIPYQVGRQLGRDWCARGANVQFHSNATPTHAGAAALHLAEMLPFFEARFAGLPQANGCALV